MEYDPSYWEILSLHRTPVQNSMVGPDGSTVRYYVEHENDPEFLYATVDHYTGYGEFLLRDGRWRYMWQAQILMSGYCSFWVYDYDASKVEVEPPTIAMAFAQEYGDPELFEVEEG